MRYLIALIVLLRLSVAPVMAQEAASATAQTENSSPSTYTLPYPGMLPDNPFYPLKMFRDHIVLFLISDPIKKAKFNLLQADKRLQAGVYLWREKPEKADLALETISKGENYFEQAIIETRQAVKEGRETAQIQGDLAQAARKHTEVLQKLASHVPPEFQGEVETLLKRTEQFSLSVKVLE